MPVAGQPSAMSTRRSLLASAGAALLAGCLSTPGGPRDGTDDDCVSGFTVSARSFDPAADLPLTPSDGERQLLDRVVAEGTHEFETYGGDPPVRDGVYVEHDGAFYRTRVQRVEETAVPARVMNIEWKQGRTPPGDATVVAFSDLPASDRRALRYAVDGPEYGGRDGRPSEGMRWTDAPLPYPDGVDDSRLVGTETWVRFDGRAYRVWGDGEETTTTRYAFRYEVEQVADDPAAFRDHVADAYLVELDDLDGPERDVVGAAVEDSYQECEPASEGLTGLRERLPGGRELPHPNDGAWFVAFDGGRYELSVTNWVH
jgi:hypothetical protein